MSIKNNTVALQNLLEQVNELPEAVGTSHPVISVSSNGLITATAGAKSSTHQLAFQPAKTITPSTASQIAVSSGYYTGGNVTVVGDANLVAGNIKSGVSIFGVNGTFDGSGGGDTSVEDGIITKTIHGVYINDRVSCVTSNIFAFCSSLTSVSFPTATYIGSNAFQGCSGLTSVSFPMATIIHAQAFSFCTRLTSVSFPKVTYLYSSAFYYCSNLVAINFPVLSSIVSGVFNKCFTLSSLNISKVQYIGNCGFQGCSGLTSVSLPAIKTICSYAFRDCYNLKSLYLMSTSVCTLSNANAFSSTPIGGYSKSAGTYGSIYVPTSLLTSYKTATNWTYFSRRFVGI